MKGDDDWLQNKPNSEIRYLIDEWCHSERNRNILQRRYLDGVSYERLADEIGMSPRQVENIIRAELKRLSAK